MAEDDRGDEEGRSFKVSDRRYSITGYPSSEEAARTEEEATPESPPAPEPAGPAPAAEAPAVAGAPPSAEVPASAPPFTEKAEPETGQEISREFETLLSILQLNSLAAMGINPQTGERTGAADQRSARLLLDTFTLAKEKMKGNLTGEEEQLFGQILADLKMIYVREVGIQ
jgi:hypothetical protein